MRSQKSKNQAGFSLAEMMIVIVLTLVVVSAAFALLRGTITTAGNNYELTSAGQDFRNSHEMISRDILRVGDGLSGLTAIWLPTPFVTNYLTVSSAATIDPTNRGYVAIGSTISDNNIAAGVTVTNSNPSTEIMPGTDRLTLLSVDQSFNYIGLTHVEVSPTNGYIRVPAARIGDFSVGEIYFLSNGIVATFGTITSIDVSARKIFWTDGDAYGLNRIGWSGSMESVEAPEIPMNLMRVSIIQHFVDKDGKLIRRVFGTRGVGHIDSVISEHLSDLQYRYNLASSGPGPILEQPTETFGIPDFARVRMIEASIEVETAYPLQDGKKHQIQGSARLGVRNVQYLEAPVPRDSTGNTALPNPGPTPRNTPVPTPTPTPTPTPPPTPTPTRTPTPLPTPTPSPTPTRTPTPTPTPTPTRTPTPTPTPTPGNGDN